MITEGRNNPHSRRIFSAKWGRLKNVFNANAGWESAALRNLMRIGENRWLIRAV